MPVVYAAAVLAASVVVGRSPGRMARLCVVYPTMHLSWGVGFIAGRPTRSAGSQEAS